MSFYCLFILAYLICIRFLQNSRTRVCYIQQFSVPEYFIHILENQRRNGLICSQMFSYVREVAHHSLIFCVQSYKYHPWKKKHYLKNFFIFFLFVHLPFHSFRVCGLQTLWSSSGLLSIKMKTSLSLFIPLLYFLSALLVCVIKIAAYQAKMDSDSYSLWLVQTTNCL